VGERYRLNMFENGSEWGGGELRRIFRRMGEEVRVDEKISCSESS